MILYEGTVYCYAMLWYLITRQVWNTSWRTIETQYSLYMTLIRKDFLSVCWLAHDFYSFYSIVFMSMRFPLTLYFLCLVIGIRLMQLAQSHPLSFAGMLKIPRLVVLLLRFVMITWDNVDIDPHLNTSINNCLHNHTSFRFLKYNLLQNKLAL